MKEEILLRKIKALLHDPPEKALVLGRSINGGHVERAKELMEKLGLDREIPPEVVMADHIASAADRVSLKGFPADWPRNPLIVHPLSGKQFPIQSLATIDFNQVMASVNQVVQRVHESYGDDLEKVYLSLWRELLPLLEMERKNDEMGQLWEVLPADTRVPDHSIWEHRRVTSAISAALPKPAFLLFTLGPVQSFIATARKAQDLWAGSYLLSYLSWQAMRVVAETWGPDAVIFPDLCGQPFADLWLKKEKGLWFIENTDINKESLSSPTLPNRFLAILPLDDVEPIAQKIVQEVQGFFKKVCFTVKKRVEKDADIIPDDTWNTIWERQVTNFLETYWAVLPWDNNYKRFLETFKSWCKPHEEPWKFASIIEAYEKAGFMPNIGTCYGKLYELTERGLGSRKATREFVQQIEPHFKCTMFSELEPVHLSEHSDFGKLREFWTKHMLPKLPMLRNGERLSSIALTKRLAGAYYFKAPNDQGGLAWDIETSFPSTSTVCTASFKNRVLEMFSKPEVVSKVRQYVERVYIFLPEEKVQSSPLEKTKGLCKSAGGYGKEIQNLAWKFARLDGDWLFEESFNKKDLQRELPHISKEELEGTLKARIELMESVDKNGIKGPSRYFAVLVMDGDNMGQWLGGEFAPSFQDILNPNVWNELKSDPDWEALGETKRPLNPALHLAISKALRDYSLHTARKIVEKEYLGKLIYSGGDDVLAFVSLRDLPEMMRALRAFFTGALKGDDNRIDWLNGSGFIRTDTGFQMTMGTEAKASMGVAIAHHMQDLGQVLNAARAEEKHAKEGIGRNAFSIALMKRSGSHESFGARWYYEKDGTLCADTIECLIHWRDAFTDNKMSPRFAYVFRKEIQALSGFSADSSEAIKKEVNRLFRRHLSPSLPKEKKDEMAVGLLGEGLFRLLECGVPLEELAKFLDLAVFLSREENR